MSQDNILKLLERETEWLSRHQIAEQLGICSSVVSRSLTILKKEGYVEDKWDSIQRVVQCVGMKCEIVNKNMKWRTKVWKSK